MTFSKILPYIGGKSDRDISIALEVFKKSGHGTFVDRFAGSHRVSLAVLQNTDAIVHSYEIDPQVVGLMKVLFFGSDADRQILELAVDWFTIELAKAAQRSRDELDDAWRGLRIVASSGTSQNSIAAFVAYIQNAGSSNPRRNEAGMRNSGYASNKIEGAASRKCKLLDLTQYADRILFNPESSEDYRGSGKFVYADVPYYYPGKTPCYEGHKPGSIAQARQYMEMAIGDGHDTVMYCNYTHPDIVELARDYGFQAPIALEDVGTASNQRGENGKAIGHSYWLLNNTSNMEHRNYGKQGKKESKHYNHEKAVQAIAAIGRV